jgi:hypothetical protein
MTVVVNLFGGPGAGKSTTAAGVFANLKQKCLNVELVTEFAKDLTWDSRFFALEQQPYILGEQFYRQIRLKGKVDAIITDSPLLLGIYYNNQNDGPTLEHLAPLTMELYNLFENLNYFIRRPDEYTEVGRDYTREEAVTIDEYFKVMLNDCNVAHRYVNCSNAIDIITDDVYEYLS